MQGVERRLFSIAYREKLIPAVRGGGAGRVFSISKVSSRDVQRHKRVTGDADSSVNSAGG